MNVVSSKQKSKLQHLAVSGDPQAARAEEILRCLDKGIVPPPEAVEWLIEWLRRGAA
jgi:hypothetical protein